MRWNVRVNRVVFNGFSSFKIVVKLETFNAFEAADRETKGLARDSRVHVNVV